MRPFLVMGAYRKGAFPLQERAARFSRVVGVLYAEALYIVQRLDETVHPSVFPQISFPQISCLNSELLRLYEEGADGSDLPRSVTCILGCFRDTCFVCRSPLQPTDDMTPPLDASEVGNYGLFMNERLCPVPYILPYSCGKHWIATRKSFTRVRGLMMSASVLAAARIRSAVPNITRLTASRSPPSIRSFTPAPAFARTLTLYLHALHTTD